LESIRGTEKFKSIEAILNYEEDSTWELNNLLFNAINQVRAEMKTSKLPYEK